MNHISLLENGGTILVVGGWNKAWQSFRDNPRVVFWTGEQKDIARIVRRQSVPTNCRAIVVSRFIAHTELGIVLREARRRRLVLFPNKTDGEVTELLDDMLKRAPVEEIKVEEVKEVIPESFVLPIKPIVQEPVTTIQEDTVANKKVSTKGTAGKGKLIPLMVYVDWTKTNAENARNLMERAKELGIETTVGSVGQYLMHERKKRGLPTIGRVPANKGKSRVIKMVKVKKEKIASGGEELDIALQMFDEAVKSLHDVRDYLIKTTQENAQLKTSMAKIQPLLEAIRGIK